MALELITIDSAELYDNIIQSMEIACGEALYPGDERRIFVEAMVQVIVSVANACNIACNNKMLQYAVGDALDALGVRTGVERLPAVPASATFRFTLAEAQASDVTVPAGTRITSNGDIYFAISEDLTIPAGSTYADATGYCTSPGSEGNGYAAGSIPQIVDLVTYVKSAVNTTETGGGADEESDDALRERIFLSNSAYSTAGPKNAYVYWAKAADASIIDVEVTTPDAGEVVIYPLCTGGALPDAGVLAAVEAACNADDVRPLTDSVSAAAPTQSTYNITLKYYTTAADEADCVESIEGEGGAIDQYVEWQCGALGRDINPDKLRALCLSPEGGTGCIRLDITYPARTVLSSTQVAKLGTLTVTHEVVEE